MQLLETSLPIKRTTGEIGAPLAECFASLHTMGSKRGGKRKYTLFAAANGAVATCAFFNSPEGCRNGAACAFKHASNADGQDAVAVDLAAPFAPASRRRD